MTWREYHEATEHSRESLEHEPNVLDWDNMPDPFRHYEGVPVFDLPADPPSPDLPALEVLQEGVGSATASNGAVFLSQVLFYSAAISASKRAPSTGEKYALRVNPSSGNLHPTEFHFVTRGLKDWPDGLYHYRPSSHMAEQRALGDFTTVLGGLRSPVIFLLTTIAWREAWKYRSRAYRYCLHDLGHAWQSLILAARAAGCGALATGHIPDDEIAQACRLNDDEWPMMIVELRGDSIPLRAPDSGEIVWFGGEANRLSEHTIDYEPIHRVHSATKLDAGFGVTVKAAPAPTPAGVGQIQLPPPAFSMRPFGETARKRRSALDFIGGTRSMSLAQLSAILDAALRPLSADFATARLVQLYMYAHRIDGLAPGVYRHWPEGRELELLKAGDQRVMAAALSLRQDLAGNACAAFSMIADLARAAEAYGDRGYRYAHFEAGAIGHRMYLAAEALGLQATGIGAFFDGEVQRYLEPPWGRVVYHFAIGYATPDPRLEAQS
jgi:SagB-type dehydrogenase family enzyme